MNKSRMFKCPFCGEEFGLKYRLEFFLGVPKREYMTGCADHLDVYLSHWKDDYEMGLGIIKKMHEYFGGGIGEFDVKKCGDGFESRNRCHCNSCERVRRLGFMEGVGVETAKLCWG